MIKRIKKSFFNRYNKFKEDKLSIYCAQSGFLSSIYYSFFSSAFRREHKAVLAGKVKHLKQDDNFFLLIRNTHRIEKGLLMRPRRKSFAKEYIGETVDHFSNIFTNNSKFDDKQVKWIYDVLTEYFNIVSPVEKEIKAAKINFENLVSRNLQIFSKEKKVPYNRRKNNFSNISFDEFYKLTKQRRSVRWFLKKEVPRKLIDNAILAANQSPSACNRQPFEYRVITDPNLLREVVDIPMGTKGYSHSIPVMIIVIGNLDAYFSERDRHLIYVDASLANMSLMLALETMGLSSCSINWPDIEIKEKKMEKFLQLKSYQRPVMCLAVGYPDMKGMVAFSEKRELNKIRFYNNEKND